MFSAETGCTSGTKDVGVQIFCLHWVYEALQVVQDQVKKNEKDLERDTQTFSDKIDTLEKSSQSQKEKKVNLLEAKIANLGKQIGDMNKGEQAWSFGKVGRLDLRLGKLESALCGVLRDGARARVRGAVRAGSKVESIWYKHATSCAFCMLLCVSCSSGIV